MATKTKDDKEHPEFAAVLVLVCVLGAAANAFAHHDKPTPAAADPPAPAPAATSCTSGADVSGFDAEQVGNATTIVKVGADLAVPRRGWVIAVATAIQESDLRDLDHGDRDSLGLFQQRPSAGWGTAAQVMDPVYAASAFYHKLLRIPDWQDMALTQAAQAVQNSAYPNAYAPHETAATALVDHAGAQLGLPGSCPAATALADATHTLWQTGGIDDGR
jgi:hypothetical protein